MRRTGQFEALRLTWRPGDQPEPHIFWESDIAKWIEAASYCLAVRDDPDLSTSVDAAIDLLGQAQQADGYLNVYFTVVRPGERFTDLQDAHELYCAGHLIEAGVAHYEATGKTTLLDIVRRYADLIDNTFSPGGPCEGGYDGHQEIELALVKLYRATHEQRYLELSRRMIEARGTQPFYFEAEARRRSHPGYFEPVFPQRASEPQRFREYNQSHAAVVQQQHIVGHSVRAMYMLSAVTDLAAEYDDTDLRSAATRLWNDLEDTKLYVTGGVGSDPSIEGFGPAFDLPNRHGYAETCAAVGLVQWAQRMSNLTGEGRYVDVLERALYNGVLSGASTDGTHYFYGNPLASNGDLHRHEWFGVACCPPNLARLISELGHYVYAQGDQEAVINLYASGAATMDVAGSTVILRQQTNYPWQGIVAITVEPEVEGHEFTLSVRVPVWSSHRVNLNGDPLELEPVDGYLRIRRSWTPGDVVELALDLAPRRVWADPRVTSAAGRVALQRGPIVYCLEGVDHDSLVTSLTLPRNAALTEETQHDGQVFIHADVLADRDTVAVAGQDGAGGRGLLYRREAPVPAPAVLTAVPYFAWGNRGLSDMTVWVRETGPRGDKRADKQAHA